MHWHVSGRIEWPTLTLIICVYLAFAVATTWLADQSLTASILMTSVLIAFFSSLQHEVIHGHPTKDQRLNDLLVFPALNLAIPYARFRDTHIAHHKDSRLTDPFDDPESNYLDASVWRKLPRLIRFVLAANNTLLGRLIIGPAVAQVMFIASDVRAFREGDLKVVTGWLWHIPAAILVILWLKVAGAMPLWAYGLAVYAGLSFLKIRTFAEHQAHVLSRGRSVIIEDRGFLAFLFLNNNLHAVHHMHPKLPWYALPSRYFERRAHYLRHNGGYRFGSYADVFRRYFLSSKDPVPHPLWSRDEPPA